MRITNSTTVKDVGKKTKSIMYLDAIPNMKLKDINTNNISYSNNEDFKIWLKRLCN